MADLTAMMQAAAGNAGGEANFIEDMFSCFLYTGSNSAQTITNGIDLAGEGGLVWTKVRTTTFPHCLTDTIRGGDKQLFSNTAGSSTTSSPAEISTFNTTGYTLAGNTVQNNSGQNFVGWTFRKQPKFFDVVTYTGTGANRTVAHNLGSVPGSIIIKRTDTTANWAVYHRSLANTQYLVLNSTAAAATGATWWNSTTPTSTVLSLGTDASVNASGGTYVAYLFAHDAGGFGLSGEDNVISCGSYTGNGSTNGPEINLGYEPQWLLVKQSAGSSAAFIGWYMFDNMRGFTASGSNDAFLRVNESNAEDPGADYFAVQSTGFKCVTTNAVANESGGTYIYIAIRRGPMKVPTTGTSVFAPFAYAGSGAGTYTTGINQDLFFAKSRDSSSYVWNWYDRLRGVNRRLQSNASSAEASVTGVTAFNNTSMTFGASDGFSSASPFGGPYIGYALTRAPGFFDEVCYTATAGGTVNHNLTVVPELIINKSRNITQSWTTAVTGLNNFGNINRSDAFSNFGSNLFIPTATTFNSSNITSAGDTYVAYLFASVPGVSRVGSYTGTGTTQVINCGFTAGSRFVMIKRTDSTGDWYVWDSARGIVAGNDPYLLLNSTAAEVTNTDFVDTAAVGFEISSTAPAEINASGGTYIFLAIA